MGKKTGPRLVLEHMLVQQIVGDELFWESNPAFLSVKDEGEAAHEKVVMHVLSHNKLGSCVGCSSVRAVMLPFMALFTGVVASLDVAGEQDFVNYIAKKRGYRPEPIIVYHKDSTGRTHELRL